MSYVDRLRTPLETKLARTITLAQREYDRYRHSFFLRFFYPGVLCELQMGVWRLERIRKELTDRGVR